MTETERARAHRHLDEIAGALGGDRAAEILAAVARLARDPTARRLVLTRPPSGKVQAEYTSAL